MKYQILFSEKNITNLSSAEFTKRRVKKVQIVQIKKKTKKKTQIFGCFHIIQSFFNYFEVIYEVRFFTIHIRGVLRNQYDEIIMQNIC